MFQPTYFESTSEKKDKSRLHLPSESRLQQVLKTAEKFQNQRKALDQRASCFLGLISAEINWSSIDRLIWDSQDLGPFRSVPHQYNHSTVLYSVFFGFI